MCVVKTVLKAIACHLLDTVQYNPMVVSEAYRSIEADQKNLVYQSCDAVGILFPILVFPKSSGEFLVIDGFKRAQFAMERGYSEMMALVLPEETPLVEIWRLLLIEHLPAFTATDVTKAIACYFFSSCGVPRPEIRSMFALPLGLQAHDQIMRRCFKVAKLPKLVLEFMHEKKLSLKQCVQLGSYSEELLLTVLSWRRKMPLSASTVMELADFLQIQMHRHNLSLEGLLEQDAYKDILFGRSEPAHRLKQFRDLMRQATHPTLMQVNQNIQNVADRMSLPEFATVSWDQTLENRAVHLSATFSTVNQWKTFHSSLDEDVMGRSIQDILDQL